MRWKLRPWERELDRFSDSLNDLVDEMDVQSARDLIAYLDAAVPELQGVQAPGPLVRALQAVSIGVNILLFVLCICLITGAILYSTGSSKSFLGLRLYHVISESMTPVIQPDGTRYKGLRGGGFYKGDAIVVKNATAEQVKVGDVITFFVEKEHKEKPWTHRVMEIHPYPNGGGITFITKGDYNRKEDDPVDGNELIGIKVLSLPRLGSILEFARQHFVWTLLLCIALGCGIFVLFLVISRRRRRSRRRRNAKRNLRAARNL
jgi:signal peptidase I